jgi:DNA-binding MarR family transcriptional regulator
MTDAEWLDPREARAWRGLQALQLRLTARLSRDLAADSDLSYSDYTVLVVLTDQAEGRLRAFELGRELGWEKSRVSHHVSRMAARGLVTREPCPNDQRGAFVVITERGRREIEAAAPGHVAAVRRYFVDRLTPAQLDTLGDIAETVLAGLDTAGLDTAGLDTAGNGAPGNGADAAAADAHTSIEQGGIPE